LLHLGTCSRVRRRCVSAFSSESWACNMGRQRDDQPYLNVNTCPFHVQHLQISRCPMRLLKPVIGVTLRLLQPVIGVTLRLLKPVIGVTLRLLKPETCFAEHLVLSLNKNVIRHLIKNAVNHCRDEQHLGSGHALDGLISFTLRLLQLRSGFALNIPNDKEREGARHQTTPHTSNECYHA